MIVKRLIVACLSLVILAGTILILTTGAADYTEADLNPGNVRLGGIRSPITTLFANMLKIYDSTEKIRSDNTDYPIRLLNDKTLVNEINEAEALPVVGDRVTLLKLLLERGALYDNSAQNKKAQDGFRNDAWDVVDDSMAMPLHPPAMPGAAGSLPDEAAEAAGGSIHSQTNEQVVGVSEGDIVKTDGQYIYAASSYSNSLRIIRADGSEMKAVSTINYDGYWSSEFYLIGNDRLAVIGSEHVPYNQRLIDDDRPIAAPDQPQPAISYDYYYGWYGSNFTVLVIYDISDRSAPVELRRVSMDGYIISTRVIDDIVYMVTNKYIWNVPYNRADSASILPYCRDTAAGENYEPFDFDRIFYIPDTNDTSYLLIGAVNVYENEPFEPTAYLGAGNSLYMSRNAMYVTVHRWVQDIINDRFDRIWSPSSTKTEIFRFAVSGTDINYTGKGIVDGSPINQYSMDEHNGYFRIATTDWREGTYVTVLRASDMNIVGRTDPLAPGEQMQSMRFMGDMGYVVTFENVDPLFTIDLADPYDPKMLGELKIPGFSQYLHPVGNGLLLGIGRDTQEIYTRDASGKETVIGFRDIGLKVSLFDVKDPYDPKEVDVLTLGEGWTEVSHNPRALMCDGTRNLYGFTMNNWNSGRNRATEALLLRVENERVTIASYLDPGVNFDTYDSRLCFIGDTLYLVHNTGITAFDYYSFVKLDSISLPA